LNLRHVAGHLDHLSGTVSDPSGAPIVNAKVEIRNDSTGIAVVFDLANLQAQIHHRLRPDRKHNAGSFERGETRRGDRQGVGARSKLGAE